MINYRQVFKVFRENYKEVPLETFGRDPYKSLISTLMSARTNDDTTLAAARRLFKVAPDMESLNNLGETKIQKLIFPVGFYKTKAKHIKSLAKTIINEYKGKIPSNREELVKLPGVGRKTANLVLNRAFGKPEIAVDTHVHRITNLLDWVNTSSPPKTELELIKIIPKNYWPEMNKLFVSIGRQYRSRKRLTEFLKKNKLI